MKVGKDNVEDHVLKALKNDNRFRNGKEIKKRSTTWALRESGPPDAPFVILPNDGKTITESYIKHIWADTKLPLTFLVGGGTEVATMDCNAQSGIRNRMRGQHFTQKSTLSDHDSDGSSKFESDDEIPVKFIIEKDKIGKFRDCKTIEKNSSVSSSKCSDSRDSSDRSQDNFDDNSRDSATLPVVVITNNKTKQQNNNNSDNVKIEKRRLRKRISVPVSSDVKGNNKKRKADEAFDSSNEDEDTSSRSTLDFIIPPPKNFQGTNNPFNQSYTGQKPGEPPVVTATGTTVAFDKVEAKSNKGKMSFPGKVRIVRTVRRRLSAKDIIIGPNQQVRRRKGRKITGDVEVRIKVLLHFG